MQRKSWVFSLVVFTCGYAHVAVAQEITVMISGGFSAALDKLAPDYQQKSGNTLHIIHGPSMGKSAEAIPKPPGGRAKGGCGDYGGIRPG